MWIFTNDAFISAVQVKDNPDKLMVRARLKGDLERLFPSHVVTETPHADYRFRVTVGRFTFLMAIAGVIGNIDYTNFKNSVEDDDRHHTYMRVWSIMHAAQVAQSGDHPWLSAYDKAIDRDLGFDEDHTP